MKWVITIIFLIIIFMSLFSFFKKDNLINKAKVESNFIVLTIKPGVDPADRELNYSHPIDKILQEKGVGEVTGGGTMIDNPDENGERAFEFSDVEIQMTSHDKKGLTILLDGLIKNNFPENTEIMLWDLNEMKFNSISSFKDYINTLN